MVPNRIQVAIGEGVVARPPHIISALGLGSCVAVTLYDTQRRIGGLAHIMLPDSARVSDVISPINREASRFTRETLLLLPSPKAPSGPQLDCNIDTSICQERKEHAPIPLPDKPVLEKSGIRESPRRGFYAETAIAALLEGLQSKGAIRQDIVAKAVGGARMFSCYEDVNTGIGQQNIMRVKRLLRRERIPLIGEDVGGHHGRSVEFYLDSGRAIVRAIGEEDREI